jgi:hypothetical protein
MATGFEADLHALLTLSRDLAQATRSMAAARTELDAATHGDMGDTSLDRACGEFQVKWGYGLQQLEKTTAAFILGLDETVHAYSAVEDEIVKSMGGSGAGGASAVGGAMGQIASGSAGGSTRIRLSGVPGTPGGPPRLDQPRTGGGAA